jgi:hypothetical protein
MIRLNLMTQPQPRSLRGQALQLKRDMRDAARLGLFDDDELACVLAEVDSAELLALGSMSWPEMLEEVSWLLPKALTTNPDLCSDLSVGPMIDDTQLG